MSPLGSSTRGRSRACPSSGASSRSGASASASTSPGAGASASSLCNSERPRAAPSPGFHSKDLVVHGAEVQARCLPGVEVVLDGDGAAIAGAVTDGNVLVEGRGPLDRGLVDLLMLPDGVAAAVGGHGAFLRAGLWVADRVLHDVVFD